MLDTGSEHWTWTCGPSAAFILVLMVLVGSHPLHPYVLELSVSPVFSTFTKVAVASDWHRECPQKAVLESWLPIIPLSLSQQEQQAH